MAAGETTVGGIVGFLRMDDDQFNRTVDAAIARIRLLNGMDADIDVDVDTHDSDEALRDMERDMDRVTRSSNRMGGSFRRLRGFHDPRVILGAIAAAIALLGPVAGATTAVLAGLTGVVGAGVLAWRGYQDEIRRGTALGQALKGEFAGLNSTFSALAGTTARAMAPGLLSSLRKLDGFLPSLNGSVGTLGKSLGHALDLTADGIISGLRNMMPLLEDGGRGAEKLAQEFADFTESQDFKDFIAYARRELPEVARDLGKLVKGLIDLAVALAPVGEAFIKVLGQIGEVTTGVSSQLGHLTQGVKDFIHWINTGQGPWDENKKNTEDNTKATQAHTEAVQAAIPVLTGQTTALTRMSGAYGTVVPTLQAAEEAQRKQAESAAAATVQMQLENDAAGILKQSLDLLNGESLSAAEAQNAFDSSLVNMGTHTTATGKKIHFTTTSIKNMSAASVALRGQLNGQIANLQRVVEANGGLSDSTGKARKQMRDMRQQIIDNAVAHGVDRKAVTDYVDSILKIPKKVPPTKLDVDKAEAQRKAKEFQKSIEKATTPREVFIATRGVVPAKVRVMQLHDAIESLRNKTVTVTVRGVMNKLAANPSLVNSADGNILRSYAVGGVENHTAQIAPAGAMRLWAEPETGGEAYIPLAPSKRARSVAIWQETGRMLGQQNGAPVVYVQNPWGPEYMRAQTAEVADGRIASYDRQQARAVRSGVGRRF